MITISNAQFTTTLTANTSSTEIGQSINFTMTVSGTSPPYYFDLYTPYNALIITLPAINNTASYVYKPTETGSVEYQLLTYNRTDNTSYADYYVTVNATPQLELYPNQASIEPFTNITFTNSITGGTPPFNYTLLNVTGGDYTIINKTVTFEDIDLYTVSLSVTDAYNKTSKASVFVNVGYQPTIIQNGDCLIVYNLSQTEKTSVLLGTQNLTLIEGFITPTYAQIILNQTTITLNTTNSSIDDGYIVSLENLSWAPILHTISVSFCPVPPPPPPPSTTSSSSTTTTTTPPIPPSTTSSTTIIQNTTSNTIAQPSSTTSTWIVTIIAVIIIVSVVAYYIYTNYLTGY